MRRRALLPLLLLLPALAFGALPSSRTQVLLRVPATPAALRGRLHAYADSAAAAGDRYGAGEAWGALGQSYAYAGAADSAIVAWQQSVALRGAREDELALVDGLLGRRGPGDVAGAIERLTRLEPEARADDRAVYAQVLGRLAWANVLAGHADSASAQFARVESRLALDRTWRFRMARAAAASGDARRTMSLLLVDAVRARGADRDVMRLLDQAAGGGSVERRVRDEIARQLRARDAAEAKGLAPLGARRVNFAASDGATLGGILFEAPHGAKGRPGAVLVMAPGDTVAAWDSLATALARHGISTFLMDLRGSGSSIVPDCPTPEAWSGREDAMRVRSGRDVCDAIRALAFGSGVDSTRVLAGAAGAQSSIAVEAAGRCRGVRALLLVSPTPPAPERAPAVLALQRLQLPVFFQIAPEDYGASYEITEALYQFGNRSVSREVDATVPGRGAEVFRSDPQLATRLLGWLDGVLASSRASAKRRS